MSSITTSALDTPARRSIEQVCDDLAIADMHGDAVDGWHQYAYGEEGFEPDGFTKASDTLLQSSTGVVTTPVAPLAGLGADGALSVRHARVVKAAGVDQVLAPPHAVMARTRQ